MSTLHFDADANKTFGTKRGERDAATEGSECGAVGDDVLRHIESSLLADALWEEGRFGHVEVKSSVLVRAGHQPRPDVLAHLGFDVSIVSISKRPDLRGL